MTDKTTSSTPFNAAALEAALEKKEAVIRETSKEAFREVMQEVENWREDHLTDAPTVDDGLHLINELFPENQTTFSPQPSKQMLLGLLVGLAVAERVQSRIPNPVALGRDPAKVLAMLLGEEERLLSIREMIHG